MWGVGQTEEGQHRGYIRKVRQAKCFNNMRNRTATGNNTESQEARQNKDSRVHQLLERGGVNYYQNDNRRNVTPSKGRGGRELLRYPQIFCSWRTETAGGGVGAAPEASASVLVQSAHSGDARSKIPRQEGPPAQNCIYRPCVGSSPPPSVTVM